MTLFDQDFSILLSSKLDQSLILSNFCPALLILSILSLESNPTKTTIPFPIYPIILLFTFTDPFLTHYKINLIIK